MKFPGYDAYDGGANTISNIPADANEDTGNKFDGGWKNKLTSDKFD
jgi:hypothetical protein